MIDFYQGIAQKTKQNLKSRYISVICVGIVAVCVVVVCSCFVDYFNKDIIVAINVAVTALASSFIYGSFALPIALLCSYTRICQRITDAKKVSFSGTVKEYSLDIVTLDKLSYHCITLQVGESAHLYMIDSSFEFPELCIGEQVTLLTVDRYVVGYLRGAQNAEK